MPHTLEVIFVIIGYVVTCGGLTFLVLTGIDKLSASRDRRRSVDTQVLALLEAIKSNTRPKP